MLVDSHAHLDFGHFDSDRNDVLDRAVEAGVVRIINPGVDPASSRRAVDLARDHPGVIFPAAGIHPMGARGRVDEAVQALAEVLDAPEIVALGETGLDLFKKYNPEADQRAFFAAQVDLARERDLPLILHCRDAFRETLEVLEAAGTESLRAVLHCFSGTWKDSRPFLDLGFYFGIANHVTYPGATGLRDAVVHLPLDRLMVETDSPYLPPKTLRGQRNEPAHVRFAAKEVAALKGVDLETVCLATTRNVHALFDRMGPAPSSAVNP